MKTAVNIFLFLLAFSFYAIGLVVFMTGFKDPSHDGGWHPKIMMIIGALIMFAGFGLQGYVRRGSKSKANK